MSHAMHSAGAQANRLSEAAHRFEHGVEAHAMTSLNTAMEMMKSKQLRDQHSFQGLFKVKQAYTGMIDKVKEKKVPGFLSWLHAMKSITFPVPFALLCAAVGFVLWITNGLGTNDILSGHRYSDREYRTMETTHTLSYKIFGYLLGFWLVTRLLVAASPQAFHAPSESAP